MKLAAVYDRESGMIYRQFEEAKILKIYETDGDEIIHTEEVGTMAESVEDIISLIMLMEADCVLCDELKKDTMELLKEEGILYYSGFEDYADDVAFAFVNGYIIFGPDD